MSVATSGRGGGRYVGRRFVGFPNHKVRSAMIGGVFVGGQLFFKVALEFELWGGFGFVNDNFSNQRIVIILPMFVRSINDLF